MFTPIKEVKQLQRKHKDIVQAVESLFSKYGETITIKASNYDQQTEKEKQI
jgi:hypothetical protein